MSRKLGKGVHSFKKETPRRFKNLSEVFPLESVVYFEGY